MGRRQALRLLQLATLAVLTAIILIPAPAASVGGDPVDWTAPEALNTNASADSGGDFEPYVATDGAGTWLAVWESSDTLGGTIGADSDILIARSTDGGKSWTAPAALNSDAATDTGVSDASAHIATDGLGNWVAVWTRCCNGLGDYDIYVARSSNDGATWTAPAELDFVTGSLLVGDDFSPHVSTDGAGNWVAAWETSHATLLSGAVGADFDIAVTLSTDNGATWSGASALNTNAGSDVGADRGPQVVTDSAGNWVAIWESGEDLGGFANTDLDILVARSTDGGATWTAPELLNDNGFSDSAASGFDELPRLATDGLGAWIAVWSSFDLNITGGGFDIAYASSTDAGATWTSTAVLTDPAFDPDADSNPHIAADGLGNWVTVWDSSNADSDVLFARSSDGGATWTAPGAVNTNAATDSGADLFPVVATDGLGEWVAAWESDDTLGGTIGSDVDVLVATGLPQTMSFSVKNPAPNTGFSGADILAPGPVVGISCASFGFLACGPAGDDIAALSYGVDTTDPSPIEAYFSVTGHVPPEGLLGSAVYQESTACGADQSHSDEFASIISPPGVGGTNTLVFDENGTPDAGCGTGASLGTGPVPGDDLDALVDLPPSFVDDGIDLCMGFGTPASDGVADRPVYMVFAPGSPVLGAGFDAADIMWGCGGFAGAHYAFAGGLGLVGASGGCVPPACDAIDAMLLHEHVGSRFVFEPGDELWISLAPGSPSLATLGATPADILYINTADSPAPVTVYKADQLGLNGPAAPAPTQTSTFDDLDALKGHLQSYDDTDRDGCLDTQEQQVAPGSQTSGGIRDHTNFWDFYDIDTENGAGAGTHLQGAIGVSDIFAVAGRFGQTGSPLIDPLSDASGAGYHTRYDRGPVTGPGNQWNTTAADGAVALSDVFSIAAQFAHSCL